LDWIDYLIMKIKKGLWKL